MTKTSTDKIARAANRLLEREGPAGVTMRRVAAAVDISPMAIYRHYPSRGALLEHLAERGFAEFLAYVVHGPPDELPSEALSRMLDAYLTYALDQPKRFELMFATERAGVRRFPEDFREGRSPPASLFADTVGAAMRDGSLKPGDAWEVGLLLWAQAHGLITLYRGGRFALSAEAFRALYRRLLGEVLHGLRP